MGKLKKLIILHLLFLLLIVEFDILFAEGKSGRITIVVKGFRSNFGQARLLIFSNKEKKYFPSEHTKAFKRYIVPIKDRKVVFTFEDLPYGEYSISVHHDEDNNNKINNNWLGLPVEGLGVSNNAKGNFEPPSFDKAKVILDKEELILEISMVYG